MSQPKSEVSAADGDARAALREALSAAADDEAAELELRRVVNALGEDAALRAEWHRAHLIGAVMQGGRNAKTLAPEARPWLQDAGASSASRRRWTRRAWPAFGAAAAVVAALAVVIALRPSGAPDAPALADAPAPTVSAPANVAVGAERFRRLASTPSRRDLHRTNLYMSRHLHQTSMSRGVAVPLPVGTPYVKIMAVQDGQAASPEGRAEPAPAR